MKKIYLHIGPYKTGSSYLQSLWNNNIQVLKDNGLIYPQIALDNNAHHKLVPLFKGGKIHGDSWETIKYLNNLDEDIILSSENFSTFDKRSFLGMQKAFSNKIIIIIFYFRNPTQQLLSRWQEKIKYGNTHSFFEYSSYFAMHPLGVQDINYFPLFKTITEVFGKNNFYLIDYDFAYKDQKMMAEFEKITGKKNIIQDNRRIVNKMDDLAKIEILRALNFKASKSGLNRDYRVRRNFVDKFKKNLINVEKLLEKIHHYDKDIILGNSMADKAIYNKLKHNYEDRFVNRISGPGKKKYRVATDQWLLEKNLIAEIDEIYKIMYGS